MGTYNENEVQSILCYAQQIEDKTLKESVAEYSDDIGGKGKLGQLIEKHYFGYENNSRQEADFAEVGLELKVCPIRMIVPKANALMLIHRYGYSAKERIIITMINYETLVYEEWNQAIVRKKLNLLLMFYIHNSNINVDQQLFKLVGLWEPCDDDLKIIKKDWTSIQAKVSLGQAHELSEGDTMYLGACTKGVNKMSVRSQPFCDIQAKKRAFSLKRSYVDYIIEELLQKKQSKKVKPVHKPWLDINGSFDDYLMLEIKKNLGFSLEQICQNYNIFRKRLAKNYINLVVSDVLSDIAGENIKKFEPFKKANIEVKCIVLQPNGIPKESMSFEQIQYTEIAAEEWEDSTIREKFENNKHLWIVFKSKNHYEKQSDISLKDLILYKVKFWNMPIEHLEGDYKALWQDTVVKIGNGIYNQFFKSSDNPVGHIRPKAKDSDDLMITPQGTYERKMCFWLNSKYVAKQIEGD
ncbi:MAG: DNA mismatch repair protein MutH [Firmicutes bacterium HGW-Firmicutes-1]|jgi:DNA mismatch repair protein MutH|nr:MAG: DNA mismatch repair protein MutH [Firmicutes bacterium HGW-Firmicutes-1]